VVKNLAARGLTAAFAESCTGGLMAKLITDIPGCSSVFLGAAVVYSNQAKTAVLGVSPEMLEGHGAVSHQAVREMTAGALGVFGCDITAAVSGVAGPEGGSPEKPVGTVWIGVQREGRACQARRFCFSGGRDLVRRKAAICALLMLDAACSESEFPELPELWS
jgi:PncC family amidohydrolase